MMRLGSYVVHPAAAMFPLITGDEFEQLVQDIKENGLRNPIVIDHDGLVLIDGRNRYLACEAAEVVPKYEQLPPSDELDLISYIISLNMRRRELTSGQKGMIGAELEPAIAKAIKDREETRKRETSVLPPSVLNGTNGTATSVGRRQIEDPRSKTAAHVADLVGTSTRAVERAKTVRRKSPTLAEKVATGTLSLNSAYNQVQNPKPIEISEKIQEAAELIKLEQDTRPIVPTGVLANITDLNTKLEDIERQIQETKTRWTEQWRETIVESLRRHIRRVDLLAAMVEGKDEMNIEDLFGDNNA